MSDSYGGSWACYRCGSYIPSGVTHACTNGGCTPQPFPVTPPQPSATKIDPFFVYERIATALERFAVASERIAAALEEKKTPDFIAKTQGTPGWK